MRPTKNGYSASEVCGDRYLCDLLSRLSHFCKLSYRYTNHCVRATVVTNLQRNNICNEAIMAKTVSLAPYAKMRSSAEKRKIDGILNSQVPQSSQCFFYIFITIIIITFLI